MDKQLPTFLFLFYKKNKKKLPPKKLVLLILKYTKPKKYILKNYNKKENN